MLLIKTKTDITNLNKIKKFLLEIYNHIKDPTKPNFNNLLNDFLFNCNLHLKTSSKLRHRYNLLNSQYLVSPRYNIL